jgi:bacteriocin-like protein
MSIENQSRAPSLNEIGDEITDAELNNVSGGDKATTTKTTTTTTTNTTKNIKNWIELESVQ